MPWDSKKAIAHLDSHATPSSLQQCARYTREAIEAGGIKLGRTVLATDYGPSLVAAGFRAVTIGVPPYRAGDVVIIDGFPGHPEGHMAMFDGRHWVSDFVQRDLYPGPSYRSHRPSFTIYRLIS